MSTSDGGKTALSGFLFQMIGALGMTAWAHDAVAPPDNTELTALVELVQAGGQVRHEYLGQDVGIELEKCGLDQLDEHVLVQFKYSRSGVASTIGPTELAEIKASFHSSIRRAAMTSKPISRCILITNRRIPTFERENKSDLQAGKPPREQMIDGVPFRQIDKFPETQWNAILVKFARSYGCFDDEIETGISTLVGELVRDTEKGAMPPINLQWMASRFTGIVDPWPLTAQEVIKADEASFRRVHSSLGLMGEPVRRIEFERSLAEATTTRALIVLNGDGGTGKSVALWTWIQGLRQASAGHANSIATMRPADHVGNNYLSALISEWAHDLNRSKGWITESANKLMLRLGMANPTARHPVLLLGLDGLDEYVYGERELQVRELLAWFWGEDQLCRANARPPCATLIVTCRSLEEMERHFLLQRSGFSTTDEDHPAHLSLDDFSWDELKEAARIASPTLLPLFDQISTEANKQWLDTSPISSMIDYDTSRISGSNLLAPIQESAGEMTPTGLLALQRLRHPILWRAYLQLDTAVQERLLQGDALALHCLAKGVIDRFQTKAYARGLKLNTAEIRSALRPLAQDCLTTPQGIYDRRTWIDRVCSSMVTNISEADQLYKEALSAGLIILEAASRWRWQHRFMCDYLATDDE